MLLKRNLLLAGGVALAMTCGFQGANAQGVFTITSKSFKDGERLATKMAGNNKQNPNCVGDNISPELSWANPPAGTKSLPQPHPLLAKDRSRSHQTRHGEIGFNAASVVEPLGVDHFPGRNGDVVGADVVQHAGGVRAFESKFGEG